MASERTDQGHAPRRTFAAGDQPPPCHCEERRDAAIPSTAHNRQEIALRRSQRQQHAGGSAASPDCPACSAIVLRATTTPTNRVFAKQFLHTVAIDRSAPVNPPAVPRMKSSSTEPTSAARSTVGAAHAPINPASRGAALRTNGRRASHRAAQARPHGNQPRRR